MKQYEDLLEDYCIEKTEEMRKRDGFGYIKPKFVDSLLILGLRRYLYDFGIKL